jgi:membrane-anchored protein YejM (alkaline phosphatase superfamily)
LVNRWEIKPVIIWVALIYLIYQLLSLLVIELMYLFSSDTPTSIFNLAWYLLVIPAAVSIYLIRITHLGQRKGILLATLISSPFAILAIMQNPTVDSFLDDFSSSANYQKSLSPLNWHLSQRVSIDAFIGDAAKLEPGEFSD